MMARMPELSSRLTSPAVKPSRLSISSCDRTRSPPFLVLPKSRLPSSTMAAHCRAIDSESSLAAAASAASAGSSLSSEASHCAAMASWSTGSLPAMLFRSVGSLDDYFLEQDRAHLDRRDGEVDPPRQLFLEAKQSRRTVEVARPELAQVGLEDIGDPRHRRLDRLDLLLFLDLEHQLELEVLHALAGRAGQIDQHVRHFDEGRRLRRRRFGVHFRFVVMAEEQEPGRSTSAEDGEHADHDDHQLEFALGYGEAACGFRCAVRLFVVR